MLLHLALCVFATLAGLAKGAPYLGHHLYQPYVDPVYYHVNPSPVFYQSVPYQQYVQFPVQQRYQQLITTPSITSHAYTQNVYSSNSLSQSTQSHEDLPQMNQFHSEDAQGRVLYGFHGHNQARMEARDHEGRVRGSYSYIDPNGQVVRMDYWDDGSGFQARGHNIPKATYDVPGYTPEVQAARDQHLKLFQQILLSTVHAQHPINKIPEDDYPYIERPDGVVSTPVGHVDDDDTVEVGNLYPDKPEIDYSAFQDHVHTPVNDIAAFPAPVNKPENHIPAFPGPVHRPENDFPAYPGSVNKPVNNIPALPGSGNRPENGVPAFPGSFPSSIFPFQDEEDLESIALDNPEFLESGRGGKSLESSDNKQEGSNKQDKTQQVDKNEKKAGSKSTEQLAKTEEKKPVIENKDLAEKEESGDDNRRHNGFAYQFQYTLATPGHIPPSPTFQKVSSIAASEPLPKDKKTSIHKVHPLPLRTMTNMNDQVDTKSVPAPSAVHDTQMAPHLSMLQRPLIIKTFPSPVAAVHDNQVPVRMTSQVETKTEKKKN